MIKITKYTTFGHFKGISTSKNLVKNSFSGSTNLWRPMGEYEALNVLLCQYQDLYRGRKHFTSKNLVLNTFSGSTNLWRLLGEYGPLGVILCYYMGFLRGSQGLKFAPNDQISDFWALEGHFHFKKLSFEYIFWQYKFMEAFGRIWTLGCTSLLVYWAFEWVRRAQNCFK